MTSPRGHPVTRLIQWLVSHAVDCWVAALPSFTRINLSMRLIARAGSTRYEHDDSSCHFVDIANLLAQVLGILMPIDSKNVVGRSPPIKARM